MPRLREVSRENASKSVLEYYDRIFGERDPVAQPGTATGTPGNWWTVFALVPHIFDHATDQFAMLSEGGVSALEGPIRELAIMRAGFVQGSQFVYSQHCKAARRVGVSEEQIAAVPNWQISAVFAPKERAVLSWVDALILERGRVSDALFETLHGYLTDEQILELTYHTLCYSMHAICCKALRLEYDDVDERVREVPAESPN